MLALSYRKLSELDIMEGILFIWSFQFSEETGSYIQDQERDSVKKICSYGKITFAFYYLETTYFRTP